MRVRLNFHGAWSCQLGRTVERVWEEEGRADEERVDGKTRKAPLMRRVCECVYGYASSLLSRRCSVASHTLPIMVFTWLHTNTHTHTHISRSVLHSQHEN